MPFGASQVAGQCVALCALLFQRSQIENNSCCCVSAVDVNARGDGLAVRSASRRSAASGCLRRDVLDAVISRTDPQQRGSAAGLDRQTYCASTLRDDSSRRRGVMRCSFGSVG